MATLGELSGWRKLTPEEIRHVYPVLKRVAKSNKKIAIHVNVFSFFSGLVCIRMAIWFLQALISSSSGENWDLVFFVILILSALIFIGLAIMCIGVLIKSFLEPKFSYKEALRNRDWIAMDVTFQSASDYDTPGPYGYIKDVNGNMLEGVIGRGKRIPASIDSDADFTGPGLYVRVPEDLYKECIVQMVFDKRKIK